MLESELAKIVVGGCVPNVIMGVKGELGAKPLNSPYINLIMGGSNHVP
jgi:hypothetical protein